MDMFWQDFFGNVMRVLSYIWGIFEPIVKSPTGFTIIVFILLIFFF